MSVRYKQAGDTLVEIMLAIAIVGMVLGASYATATRALRTGRFAQEQTEALKLAESQLEKVKYIATTSPAPGTTNDVFNANAGQNVFCIDDNFTKVASTAAACMNISGLYNIAVTYTLADSLFNVAVTWQRPQATDGIVQVSYRLYK